MNFHNNSSNNEYFKPSQGLNQTGKSRWVVMVAKLVPDWGLQRGTILINDEPLIVSSRIDESLRLRSVKATFNTNHAEAACTTEDLLQYKISLYSGPNNNTYVEVIRMQGCTYAFRGERQAIFNTAKGLGAKGMDTNYSKKFRIPSSMKDLYLPRSINELESILDRASDEIHSIDRSAVLFTLQNLAFMTNSTKSHSETAQKLSKLFMRSKNGIRDMIVSIYASEARNMNCKISEQICNACLCIFINGMAELSKNESFFDQECGYFIENLTTPLLHNLESIKCTHSACLALRCLSLLVGKSPIVCATLNRSYMSNLIGQAVELGSREHLMLEETARSTMSVLQSKLILVN